METEKSTPFLNVNKLSAFKDIVNDMEYPCLTILLLDDNALSLRVRDHHLIKTYAYTVHDAESKKEAYEYALKFNPPIFDKRCSKDDNV